VLEFGGEVAFEIVLDDEDAEEIGVAAGAQDVPGEGGQAEGRERSGMKEAQGVAPAFGEERPKENGAATENDRCGAFGEDGEAEKEAEENKSELARLWNDGRVFVAGEAKHYGGAHHCNGEHGAEGHVCGGGMREADHADSCG